MRAIIAGIILSLLLITLTQVEARGLPPQVGNVSKSEAHAPTYLNPFTRLYFKNITGYNITINYTKVPRIEQGVRPRFSKPQGIAADAVASSQRILLDPRTCPNDLAFCYQVRNHSAAANTTPLGRNYSSLSTYQLPPRRIKTFVCIGDDLECVKSATSCYCPTEEIDQPPIVWGQDAKCSDRTHLCLDTFSSFKLCKGNLTDCQKQYNLCGCGVNAACIAATRNTCVNERNELVICESKLSDCLTKYKTCYCGDNMMPLQKGCATYTHKCERNGKPFVCNGKFEACALQADRCDC